MTNSETFINTLAYFCKRIQSYDKRIPGDPVGDVVVSGARQWWEGSEGEVTTAARLLSDSIRIDHKRCFYIIFLPFFKR